MARYAVYRTSDGLVSSFVEWDGGSGWAPPAGYSTVQRADGNIGDTWNGSAFVPGTPPYVPPYRYRAGTIYMGSALIDFGDGSPEAMVDIDGQDDLPDDGIDPNYCYARAWMTASKTADNDHDAHVIGHHLIKLTTEQFVTGTGFTIHATCDGECTGEFRVKWAWN